MAASTSTSSAALGSKISSAVKRIIMSDSDVGAVSAGCAAGTVGAVELFVERLTAAALDAAAERKTRKVDVGHMYGSESHNAHTHTHIYI